MKKIGIILLMLVCFAGLAFANLQDVFEEVEELHEAGEYQECIDILEDSLSQARTDSQKAEVYWRMARATLNIGNELRDEEAPQEEILETFEQGEAYADQAIAFDPSNHLGYFWKSSNIGMWGQTKGVLDSLFKAGPMRDLLTQAIEAEGEHADSYYVLGQLYRELPGWPVSFGDAAKAVSLGRLAVDLNEEDARRGDVPHIYYDFQTELAKSLWARDWNTNRRNREQNGMERRYNRANNPLERGFNYEGTVNIPNMSDQEEALNIVRNVIRSLERVSNRNAGQQNDLEKARELLEEWES